MNFLSKTLSTLTGASFPYNIEEKIVDPGLGFPDDRSIWNIYNGKNPRTNTKVTIFEFNLKDPVNVGRDYVSLARNSFKKLKLIKHPGVIAAVDYIENENYLYIVTERVLPIYKYLQKYAQVISDDGKWMGLYEVGKTLQFINTKCNCIHGAFDISSGIYVNSSGDWKVFGFELLTNLSSDPDQPFYRNYQRHPVVLNEISEQIVSSVRLFPPKFDSFLYGMLIYKVMTMKDIEGFVPQSKLIGTQNRVPRALATYFKRLVNQNFNLRCTIDTFMNDCEDFFSSNRLVLLNNQLDELKLMTGQQKYDFIKFDLKEYLADDGQEVIFSPGFLENKLLPEIILQYSDVNKVKPQGGLSPEQIQSNQELKSILLHYILKISRAVEEETFNSSIKPVIFENFSSADRSIRLNLLTYLPDYIEKLSDYEVQQKVFSPLIAGFHDTNFMIRETTLKSVAMISDKITEKQINNELLRLLAKSQVDPKPSIRTNTLVLIIKISDKIYKNSRNNVIITVLSKSLRDSFTPCKMMALSGFEQLIKQFDLEEICSKILGQLAISLMDKKAYKVRQEAKRIFDLYLGAVEEYSASLPVEEEDEELEEKQFFERNTSPAITKESTVQNSSSNSGFSLGWNVVGSLINPSTVGGEMNNEFNNSTPDLMSQIRKPLVATDTANGNESKGSRLNLNVTDDWDDDGWDEELNLEDETSAPQNVTGGTGSNLKHASSKVHKDSSIGQTTKKVSSMKLGGKEPNKNRTKLQLTVDEDEWGGTDDW